jgi:hypothetical protein
MKARIKGKSYTCIDGDENHLVLLDSIGSASVNKGCRYKFVFVEAEGLGSYVINQGRVIQVNETEKTFTLEIEAISKQDRKMHRLGLKEMNKNDDLCKKLVSFAQDEKLSDTEFRQWVISVFGG